MSDRMRRREFLVQSGQTGLGLSLLPLVGCVTQKTGPISGERSEPTRLRTLIADLEKQIPTWMQEAMVPGLSIAVIKDGNVAWHRGFGVKDAASNESVADDTMFEAASMSKPVFAYLVMKLCETGVMNLDTPLTKYTPERFLEGDARLELITARHVLSHTTGFQNWRSDEKPLTVHFTPGEKFLYSGEGYNYLQTVVTRLIGQPFERYMATKVLAPFRMTSSGYVWNDTLGKRMARPHGPNGKPTDNNKSSPASVARYGSAGALLTTATDYARFVIEVISPKPSDATRLKRDSLTEMLRPHVTMQGGQYPASWALGWQIFHNQDRDFIYHGGDNAGFHCAAVASVEGRSGFVAMTNGEGGVSVLRNLLIEDLMQQFLAN